MQKSDMLRLLMKISDKSMRAQKKIFIEKTGMSIHSFFRYRKEIGLKVTKRDVHTEEAKLKMSKTAIKNWKNPEIRKKHSEHIREKHANWRGGKSISGEGYILIYVPDHPFSVQSGYIFEHRLVMEQWLRKNDQNNPALMEIDGKKYLRKNWIPHHKNEKRDDNRIENLKLMTKSEHQRFHSLGEKNPWFGCTGNKSPFYGHKHTEETKRIIGQKSKCRKITDETRKKMSLAHIGKASGKNNPMFGKTGKNHPNYGKPMSHEQKIKISKALKRYYRMKNKKEIQMNSEHLFG